MYNVVLALVLINAVLCDDLVAVVVIYRHGDRTPIDPYPTDPYRNQSYWPVGFGQLTNLGKRQLYHLGKWLRDRYDGFLPTLYSDKDLYVHSTDFDRTLMSAEANLAGLFPPRNAQIWEPAIPWQPIPIHTIPMLQDNLLLMGKPCWKYDLLMDELFQTEYFRNISREYQDLLVYLSNYSGKNVEILDDLVEIYDALFVETLYNYTLPVWAWVVFPELKPWAEFNFAVPCWTRELTRLKVGPLFDEIIQHFSKATNDVNFRKFLMFSAHDSTIANVLMAMGAYDYHLPPYGCTLMIELRRGSSVPYINVLYKNSNVVYNITLAGCDFDCDINSFVNILKPIVLSKEQRDLECQPSWYFYLGIFILQYYLYGIGLVFIVFGFIVWLGSRFVTKERKRDIVAYVRLPEHE